MANLHVSDDGRCVVNYAQWQSKADFEKAMQVPEFQAHMKQVKDLIESFDPVLTNFVIARADLRFEASALLLVVATLGSKLRPRRAGSPSITGRLSSITWQ